MNNSNDDKTQIKPAVRNTDSNASSAPSADDKTRIAPKKSNLIEDPDKTRITKKNPLPDDKTRIAVKKQPLDDKTRIAVAKARAVQLKKKQQMQQQAAADDRTRIKQPVDDKTRIKTATPEPSSSGADDTQFSGSTRTQMAPAGSDRTEIFGKTQMPNPNRLSSEAVAEEMKSGAHGLLKKRFVLEKVLGAGGMGVVYKAKDLLKIEAQDRDPYVAVKVLSEEFKSHPEAFIALQRESRKSQRIAHPNIVNVHDFDRDGDQVFMTMEFLDGKPLDKLISQYRSTGLPHDEVWQILEGISSALEHAHKENIIHSDFKPGNIFVTNKGVAKVFDFGIARAVAKAEHLEESIDDKTVFDAGNLGALTPAYASLEMLEGSPPDVRDDIYALGCIAYELFTGEHPYNRVHADEAARQKLKAKRIPGLTKRQWKTIERAIAFKRPDRVATVEEFWDELSTKRSSSVRMFMSLFIIMFIIAGAYYQFGPQRPSDFKEDEVRNEIEYQLRLELQTEAINSLMQKMMFTPTWEQELWTQIQAARELMGRDDVWLLETEGKIYAAYLDKINEGMENKAYTDVERWLAGARNYTSDDSSLVELDKKLALALEAKKKAEQEAIRQQQLSQQRKVERAEQAKVEAKRRSLYDAALKNVNEQLACRSNIDMKDLGIAVNKLRDLDMARYQKEETRVVSALAVCLEKIGRNFPERAKDSKKAAMRLFESNKIIAGINIIPKDPCDSSLEGLGARGKRAICRDRIPMVGKGPALVVVPGRGNIRSFAIGKYEITVGEINEYCEASGKCSVFSGNEDYPVTNLPVETVKNYLKWLSNETKKKYRLPTRSEWLYAAEAGKKKLDSNRNCTLSSRGIQKGGSLLKASVGQQNAWGLVNHIGNAREWVVEKSGGYSVVGGSHSTPMENCNFDYRESHNGAKDKLTGFRVLREVDKSAK
ncbi:protein kinase domain-containing protein [Teredinibacter sp. KSP-S5-2]|uniref:protein kinase domain-containing protein n=1 Tax=Teredinibacter sp. KSP-S5-2 TaxID=3034506 RepID=UPI0029344947|nr:protein kinase [Teredinibacter sp. KSP-S5-2]WNO08061.1 protein kinase [Teredinibacter sp. KSP-S5-2]